MPTLEKAQTPLQAAKNGFDFFKELQLEDGHWGCEYGGPMFLIPGLIIAMYITETPIPEEWKIEITRYLALNANPTDGGWGLHVEDKSTVFGTVGNYITLRILGMDPDHPVAVKARATLHKLGGPLYAPLWAKFWLSCLNCYSWDGVNPIPPDIWLLPYWVPIHPGRWWLHCRNVFVGMGYFYGKRWSKEVNPFIESLREEIYPQPFASIDFSKYRNTVSSADLYRPHNKILDTLNYILVLYDKYLRPKAIADRAQKRVYELIQCEDVNTDYLCIGPVNNVIHLMACWLEEGPESYAYQRHVERLADFMWMSNDGLRMNGTNGVQLWDTAFVIQAIHLCGFLDEPKYHDTIEKALSFMDISQIREDCENMDRCYRDKRKGAWPFSTRHQGYTVSDCASEGLKAVLLIQSSPKFEKKISLERLRDSVDVLLSMQNSSGGYSSYESIRASPLLEYINPAEVFDKIMVEYDYPECTTSVVTALSYFRKYDPDYKKAEIQEAIDRAVGYIEDSQRPDGSWYGSWGVCFTYAGWFATESLATLGFNYRNNETQKRACDFILSKQESDGGWGESYKVCICFFLYFIFSKLNQKKTVL